MTEKVSFDSLYENAIKTTYESISKRYQQKIDIIENMLNLEWEISRRYASALKLPEVVVNEETDLLLEVYLKNLFNIRDALHLLKRGSFGNSMTILRQCFESLIISKYACLSSNSSILQKWNDGDYISMGRNIFPQIKEPSKSIFKRDWDLLCELSHASHAGGTRINHFDLEKDQLPIYVNFAFIKKYLECNYHLFNTYFITSSIRYYTEYYDKHNPNSKPIKEVKKDVKFMLTENKKNLLQEDRLFIYHYKLKWKIGE